MAAALARPRVRALHAPPAPRRARGLRAAAPGRDPGRQPPLGCRRGPERGRRGHRRGADKIEELLDWCAPLGIEEITLWALSNENLGRPGPQLDALFEVVCDKLDALEQRALATGDRHARARDRALGGPAGSRLGDDPPRSSSRRRASRARASRSRSATAAGTSSSTPARRSCSRSPRPACRLRSIAEEITRESLAARLYTAGLPDPDLIIRTSGEQRLSGFLPWQSAHSELYFTDVYWPAFREIDLLRALRTYQQRVRRHGL